MSAERRIGQVIGGVISNPTFILYFVVALVVLIVAVRFMRKDKRKAKQQAKAEEQQLILQQKRDKTVYAKAAETFGIDERSARLCDDIAMRVNGALNPGTFGNDNEAEIIKQLNRLAGTKTIKCADFFYKKYQRRIQNPNIAFDGLNTLNLAERKSIKAELMPYLEAHAKLKGTPGRDLYFFDGKQFLHGYKVI